MSSRASPGGSTALRTRCTRRSLLMTVPSVSAQLAAAGNTTSAMRAVLVMRMSCTTRKSRLPKSFSCLCSSASDWTGFSPITYMHRISPFDTASIISAWFKPTCLRQRSAPYILEERVRLGVVPPPAADLLVRQGAHVAAALHVVLAAQGVEAGTVLAHVPGQKSQVDEREHAVGAVVVLGDAQRPVQRRFIGGGVHAGHLAYIVRRDARDLLGVLRRVAGDLLPVRLEAFRGAFDELFVVQVFLDDDVAHRVGQADVGADVEAQPLVRLFDLVYLARVDHDHLRAVLDAAAHVVVDDGVALHGVGTPADYYVGVLELLVRGGRPARSKRCHQTGDAGGVSSTVTRVYVAVPEHLPDELPCQVVELVGRARGAEGPEGVGTMLVLDLAHLARDQVQRLVPGSRERARRPCG